jgi:alpha-D-ribose 1-methylphosphonate 5-triphosphate diphosphatase
MTLRIDGGQVLLPEGLAPVSVAIRGEEIAGIDGAAPARRFDARGLLVLPGIVDLHGDAFERQVQPRPGVAFAADIALADTEAQLLANGITTAYHAVTLSWEPGLRSPDAWRVMLDALAAHRGACDMRVHMRWELHNLDALDMALSDIEAGRVGMVAFNDHTPAILRKLETTAGAAKYSERAMMGVADFRALAEQAMAKLPETEAAAQRIAAAARARNLPMASHDDDTVETRARYRALGASICEFPVAEEVGVAAVAAGEAVVMGCPNVVRGGSHLGWASAAALAERGVCTTLVSDYYYPAMLRAGLHLADGPLGLGEAWALVSRNPARAAGLLDRGWIGPGARADLVIVDPGRRSAVATIAGGRVAHLTADGWSRLS